ncbi:primosomal protein N' [Hyphobacterium marinum]
MPLPEAFDYAVPDGMEVRPGDHVHAPLGPRSARGVVWSVAHDDGSRNLKPLDGLIGGAPLAEGNLAFIDWASKYLVQLPGNVLRAMLRGEDALRPSPVETVYRPSGEEPTRLTEARQRVLDAADLLGEASAADLAREAGVSSGVVSGLVKAGGLVAEERPADPPFADPDPEGEGLALTELQADAAATLRRLVRAGGFQSALLDGVTGSGKTEVYFEAIAEALRTHSDGQILVLLPEIALTQAIMARFKERFGAEPAEWHSGLNPKQRRRVWREINEGRARIVVGARSALFLPFRKLSLVVVDEEHDPTYKQGEGLTYQARDLAVARAKIDGATVILASATPSLESLANARAGRYVHIRLPARIGAAVLPDISTIDLRETPAEAGRWLSPPMVEAMAETFERGEQTLLYLNRRGYAPLVLCRACGHRFQSPDTDTPLVEHRYTGRLVCHLTGFSMPKPDTCPDCGAKDSLTSVGPGVERVAEEAKALFPQAVVEIFSSDISGGGEALRDLIARMERSEIDILVGTQIAAKGHNFPNLTLVGVVDADLGLAGGDPRAGERTYQTLVQVAGRAGRADRKGRAILQTHDPDHDAIAALVAGDRDRFLDVESQAREMLGLPPYGRLASIVVSAESEDKVIAAAAELARTAPRADGVEIWGPAEPRYGVLRGRWRRRLLVRADKSVDISAYLASWKARVKIPASVRVVMDVDPYSFV